MERTCKLHNPICLFCVVMMQGTWVLEKGCRFEFVLKLEWLHSRLTTENGKWVEVGIGLSNLNAWNVESDLLRALLLCAVSGSALVDIVSDLLADPHQEDDNQLFLGARCGPCTSWRYCYLAYHRLCCVFILEFSLSYCPNSRELASFAPASCFGFHL